MVAEPPQPRPPPVATFSPPCPPLSAAAVTTAFSLPPSLSSLRCREELLGAEQKKNNKKKVDKLIDTENSLAIRSNRSLPSSTPSSSSATPSWPVPSSSPSRAFAPPSSPSSTPPRPSLLAPSSASSPRLLLHLLLLHSSSHGEPPTRLQAVSHDPLFGRSKLSNREASGPLGRDHHRPRSPRRAHHRPRSPVLTVVFLINGAAPCSSSSTAPSSTARPSVPSSFSLSLSPPSDLSSSPAPSPISSAPASRPPSLSSTSTPPPSPASSPSSLFTAAASSGFSLAVLNLASPTSTSSRNALSGSELRRPSLPRRHPPPLPTWDLSLAGHRCLDIIPRRPPLASCRVAIVGHPGRAATRPPSPLPLSSHETKENPHGSTRGR